MKIQPLLLGNTRAGLSKKKIRIGIRSISGVEARMKWRGKESVAWCRQEAKTSIRDLIVKTLLREMKGGPAWREVWIDQPANIRGQLLNQVNAREIFKEHVVKKSNRWEKKIWIKVFQNLALDLKNKDTVIFKESFQRLCRVPRKNITNPKCQAEAKTWILLGITQLKKLMIR